MSVERLCLATLNRKSGEAAENTSSIDCVVEKSRYAKRQWYNNVEQKPLMKSNCKLTIIIINIVPSAG